MQHLSYIVIGTGYCYSCLKGKMSSLYVHFCFNNLWLFWIDTIASHGCLHTVVICCYLSFFFFFFKRLKLKLFVILYFRIVLPQLLIRKLDVTSSHLWFMGMHNFFLFPYIGHRFVSYLHF